VARKGARARSARPRPGDHRRVRRHAGLTSCWISPADESCLDDRPAPRGLARRQAPTGAAGGQRRGELPGQRRHADRSSVTLKPGDVPNGGYVIPAFPPIGSVGWRYLEPAGGNPSHRERSAGSEGALVGGDAASPTVPARRVVRWADGSTR